jgi:membrane associated rhomboid family serine protease
MDPRCYEPQVAHPVTDALLFSNVATFVLSRNRERLAAALAKSNARLAKGQLYRLATSCLLHANSAHLLVNCLSLSNIGPSVEHFFGSRRFAVLYTAAGISGNLLSWGLGRAPISVGASGAIFGLVGGWGVLLAINKDVLKGNGFPKIDENLGSLAQMCALNLALGLTPGSHLDNFGHIGGFIGGAACASLIGPQLFYFDEIVRGTALGFVDDPIIPLRRRRKPTPPPPKSILPDMWRREIYDS